MVYHSNSNRDYKIPLEKWDIYSKKGSKPEIIKIKFLEYRINNNIFDRFEVLIEKNAFGLYDYYEKQLGMCEDASWREMSETDSKRVQDYLNGELDKVLLEKPRYPRDNKPNWVWD
ncbi:MAG: hypothetical protein WC867_01785 [Candidatus Pacearchaeota archaeon]|jgi:hypothetical protein